MLVRLAWLGRGREKREMKTYDFANRTFHRFLPTAASAAAIPTNINVARGNHAEDGFLLETVRAFLRRDGVFHREQGERAFYTDAFGCNG